MAAVLVDLGAVPVGQPVALVLVQNREPPPGKGDEFGKASPVGLVVIVLLLLATVLLVRSMTKHLRKVPASFDGPTGPAAESPGPETGQGGGTAPGIATGTRSGDDPADGPARD